ncbi:hypothetical protein [Brevibacillus brevis]|nr:hypothetical protein [Brevibacillus brevis]
MHSAKNSWFIVNISCSVNMKFGAKYGNWETEQRDYQGDIGGGQL